MRHSVGIIAIDGPATAAGWRNAPGPNAVAGPPGRPDLTVPAPDGFQVS